MPDIFDRLTLDIFDRIELPVEEKAVYSKEMQSLLKETVREEISNLPIGKLVADSISKAMEKKNQREQDIEKRIDSTLNKFIDKINKKMAESSDENQKFFDKMKSKFDDLKNEIASTPRYEFGGFPPPGGGLPISTAGITDWRIIPVGDNLSIQKYENGQWVEKGSFNP